MEEILLRQLTADDIPFLYDSWLNSYRDSPFFSKKIRSSIFFKFHRKIVSKLLEKSQVIIAAAKEDPDIIIAYIVFDETKRILHYVYVKEPFRHLGIASKLLDIAALHKMELATHFTIKGEKIAKKLHLRYCPYFGELYEKTS